MPPTDLVALAGGRFTMGSDHHYPEEAPAHERTLAPFSIERHPVTNVQFAEFVAATGYVTVAEEPIDPADFPGADPADLVPGALMFTPSRGPVNLADWQQWWRWQPGACWRHPEGPGTDVDDRSDHPVVQVAYRDAAAYADWAGRRLPTEAEWEFAARGGLAGREYAWGDEFTPGGTRMANTWQGAFPYRSDGWGSTSPIGSYPPNGYDLVDMIGNVWERTTDVSLPVTFLRRWRSSIRTVDRTCWRPPHPRTSCGSPRAGSFLCAPEYCRRYRPAARSAQSDDSATSHLGFRCATDRIV